MSELHFNPWFIAILLATIILWKVDFFTSLLNLKAFQDEVPTVFADLIDEETHERSRDYTRTRAVFGICSSAFSMLLFFGFWWLGGFGWLDDWVRSFGLGPIWTGVIYIGALFVAGQVVTLPFQLYSTFGIEAKFGFNQMSVGLFVADMIKGLVLSAIIGVPLLLALLWVFQSVPLAWLWGWLIVVGFMLVGVFLAPSLIMPLFNKFEPLEEGELRTEIYAMAEKCDFPLADLSIMDGSKRSSKSNAFFTGFGPTKRIVLFDTLVEQHTVDELVAVLAHEIGHYKKRHVLQGIGISILTTGVMFFILGLLLNNRALFDAFAVKELSVYVSLVLFGILMGPINQVLSVGGNWLSRKNEFEADAYAAQVTGQPEALVRGLRQLSVDHLSHLTPHPAYVFLNYSHPPVSERIEALSQAVD